jgi:hypothetical protein
LEFNIVEKWVRSKHVDNHLKQERSPATCVNEVVVDGVLLKSFIPLQPQVVANEAGNHQQESADHVVDQGYVFGTT